MEEKIIIEIDENGRIMAEADNFTGPVCLSQIEELLSDIAEIQHVKKTDGYYKEAVVQVSKQNVNSVKNS